jgi:hypothetical protein
MRIWRYIMGLEMTLPIVDSMQMCQLKPYRHVHAWQDIEKGDRSRDIPFKCICRTMSIPLTMFWFPTINGLSILVFPWLYNHPDQPHASCQPTVPTSVASHAFLPAGHCDAHLIYTQIRQIFSCLGLPTNGDRCGWRYTFDVNVPQEMYLLNPPTP